MEALDNKLKRKGSELVDDRSMRVPCRSSQASPRKGAGGLFADLGMTAYITGKDARTSRGKNKDPVLTPKTRRQNMLDSSPDEIDCLSSDDYDTPSQTSRTDKVTKQNEIINGTVVSFPPPRQLPSFKKKSSTSTSQQTPTPSSSLDPPKKTSSTKLTSSYTTLSQLAGNENGTTYGDDHRNEDDIDVSRRISHSRYQEFPASRLSPLGVADEPVPVRKGLKGKERERERDDARPPLSQAGSSKARPSRTPAATFGYRRAPLREHSPNGRVSTPHTSRRIITSEDSDDETPRTRNPWAKKQSPRDDSSEIELLPADPGIRPRTTTKEVAPFPFLPPLGSPGSPGSPPPASKRNKGKEKLASFPSLSPLKEQQGPSSKTRGGFPMLSPLSSPVQSMSQKVTANLKATKSLGALDWNSDDDEDGLDQGGLRPFPMSIKELKSIRQGSTGASGSVPLLAGGEELIDNSLFMDDTDPSTLCPYCDEKLPVPTTPYFQELLVTAKRKSYPEPRLGNARGLKAPLAAFIAVCQRHRFEAHEIPKARARGWPTTIEFGKLRERVESLVDALSRLVHGEGRAREDSEYWSAVVHEMQAKGSRAVAGVKGQFESFDKTQPGYYGELGSMILHQTLYNLFPPSIFDAESIAPLTPPEFIQRILVPETAVALIMQDTHQSRADAARTMRESAAYGIAMFPESADGDADHRGAGEEIVKQRAMARRRELDAEERVEEKMLKENAAAAKQAGRPKPRRVAKTREMQSEPGSATEVEEGLLTKTRPQSKRPRKVPDPEGDYASGYTSRDSNTSSAVRSSKRIRDSKTASTAGSRAGSESSERSDRGVVSDASVNRRRLEAAQDNAIVISDDDDDIQIIESPVRVPEVRRNKPQPRPASNGTFASSRTVDNDATPKARKTRQSSRAPSVSRSSATKANIRNRDPSVEILNSRPSGGGDWSQNLREPIQISSDEEKMDIRGASSSKLTRQDSNGWLFSSDD